MVGEWKDKKVSTKMEVVSFAKTVSTKASNLSKDS
jgi:hypothetical protein